MGMLIFKYATTALIIVIVSEVAKKSGKIGAIISSLPIVTILVMMWMFIEKQDSKNIAEYAYYTFWFVIPTLPMFLLMPYMLNKGFNFWISLISCVILTGLFFIITALVCRRFGVDLIP